MILNTALIAISCTLMAIVSYRNTQQADGNLFNTIMLTSFVGLALGHLLFFILEFYNK